MKNYKLIVIQSGEQRIGQNISNFLRWLNYDKKIDDPFFVSDNKMIQYWSEYNQKYDDKRL